MVAPLEKIITRILRLLTRLGHLIEEEGVIYVADAHGIIGPQNLLAPLQVASGSYRIAHGPRAGREVLSLRAALNNAASLSNYAVTLVARPSPTSDSLRETRPSLQGRMRNLHEAPSGLSFRPFRLLPLPSALRALVVKNLNDRYGRGAERHNAFRVSASH